MMLSPHISLAELTHTDRAGYDLEQAEGAARVLPALRATAALLEEVRALLGDRPIIVHSGYRCPRLNAAIGGSVQSQHMRGEAADWHVVGLELEAAFGAIRQSGLRWGQLILEGSRPGRPSWIHLSLGEPWRPGTKCQQVLTYDGTRYRSL
jgi:hypothetical protein